MPLKQDFSTVDVVALYLGKQFDLKQMPKIKKIVEFLVGGGVSFTYTDKVLHNQIQNILVRQHQWLGSLRYNHSDYENWMKNLVHNHGATLEITK